jgi:hypothetical protein
MSSPNGKHSKNYDMYIKIDMDSTQALMDGTKTSAGTLPYPSYITPNGRFSNSDPIPTPFPGNFDTCRKYWNMNQK